MANDEHLQILKCGAEVWNQWREENPEIQPDLADADLKGAILAFANLCEADLKGANLFMTDLREADLRGAILAFANLREARNLCEAKNLCEADLSGAYLREAELSMADLSGAYLREAELSLADLRGATLADADLNGTLLDRANLTKVTGLTQEQINEAWGDKDTELPEGLQRPAHWLEELETKPLFLRVAAFMASLFSRRR